MNKKIAFLLVAVVAIAVIGCTAQTTSDAPPPLPDDAQMADTSDQAGLPSDDGVREFVMTAFQFGFDPATITVKKGDAVRIRVTSTDVVHSLVIPEYGIDERLAPDDERTIEFVADKAGEFEYRCGVYCGEDHREMVGKIVVEE